MKKHSHVRVKINKDIKTPYDRNSGYLEYEGEEAIIEYFVDEDYPMTIERVQIFPISKSGKEKAKKYLPFMFVVDLEELEPKDLEVQKMLKQREEEAYKRKYMWGKCEKCGEPLDMHYVKWCPYCIKKEDLVSKRNSLDMLMVLKWCDVRNEGIKDRFWEDLCNTVDFRNDSFHVIDFEDWAEYNEDAKYIYDNFGYLGVDLFEFSW